MANWHAGLKTSLQLDYRLVHPLRHRPKSSDERGEDAAVPAASGPAGRGRVARVGRLRRGRWRHHDALAAGDRVAVPLLPGAAGRGLHGAVPLDDAAAAAVGGDVPPGSGVPPVGGAPCRQQRGGMAAAARRVLCFLGVFAVTRPRPLPWVYTSTPVAVQFRFMRRSLNF